jgi:hypothetical protein
MDAIALIRIALSIITDRLLVILAMGLSFSLACWTMYFPTWERMATMAFFSIFSYLVINIKERNHHESTELKTE